MKKLLALIVILGIAGGGYYLYSRHTTAKEGTTPAKGTDVTAMLEEGNLEEVISQAEKNLKAKKASPKVLLAGIKAAVRTNRADTAQKFLKALKEQAAQSEEAAEGMYLVSTILQDEARRKMQYELVNEHFDSPWAHKVAVALGDYFYEKGEWFEARRCYSCALSAKPDEKTAEELKKKLTEINKKLVFSKAPTPDSVMYTVKPGDSLAKIAKKYGTTPAFIKRINKLESYNIFPGQRLKIITAKPRIVVNRDEFRLTLYFGRDWIKEYKIGTGAKGSETPLGKFKIKEKIKNPPWMRPGKPTIPFGDPRNILGTRWLSLEGEGLSGYGIHGCKDPSTIGQAVSNGCIRMYNKDVEELFDIVPRGTEVVITK